MQKQTVAQRFAQEQAMKQQPMPSLDASLLTQTIEQQSIQLVINQIKTALAGAHQSVLQAQAANPIEPALEKAAQKLNFASMEMGKIQTAAPELTAGLSKGLQQQISQLAHQIEQAASTLQLIDQSIQSNA